MQPIHPIHSQSEQKEIGELIHSADPHAMVTGWSYTLWDLIPWAKGELVEFTTIVGLLILALLWIVYRKFSLWLVHASALAMSMLGLVSLWHGHLDDQRRPFLRARGSIFLARSSAPVGR